MAEKIQKSIIKDLPIFTPVILFVSMLSFFSPEVASMLIFNRTTVAQGELWRLFSSHFVHFTNTHLAYNLLAFGVAGWIVERKSHFHFCLLYMLMTLAISLALFVLKPSMNYYGGLSGIACGFIFYCALLGAGESGPWKTISKLVIFILPIKIIIEIYSKASILPHWGQEAFVTMPTSHLAGIAVAFLFYSFVKKY